MKKYLQGFSFLLMVIITLTFISSTASFSALADEGYKEGYSEGLFDGAEKAEMDMEEGNRKSYRRAMPSEDEIIRIYKLSDQDNTYINSFLDGYEEGFEYSYNKTFKDSDDKAEKETVDYGITFGRIIGELYGYRDYYDGKSNRWDKSLPSDSSITNMFNLKKETSEYRYSFISFFKEEFQKGYEEGFRKANFEPIKISYEKGKQDAAYFGGLLGSAYGKKDFYANKASDWESNLPSEKIIISEFSLNEDSEEYLDGFLTEFKRTFREKYNESYRQSNTELFKMTYENGFMHGIEIGRKAGANFAKLDLLLGLPNDNVRHKLSDFDIINQYKLYLENEKYKEGFVSGYNEGLLQAYITTYQENNANKSLEKMVSELIPISGGNISSPDNRIGFKINKGTYYNDIIVSIDKLNDIYGIYQPNPNWIKASDIYAVKVDNPSYQFDNSKQIELSFEYYGTQNGGIYKYINNRWVYLPSKISENRITAYISPSSLNAANKIYAVFVDESFKNIKDIRGHWAKDEINAYARRGLAGLFNDNTYRPDLPITRGQLLGLLSRVYNWNLNDLNKNIKELEKLEDYESLGDYKPLILYSLKHGYMGLYPDNTFKVNNKVTYKQVNYIMKKITGEINFNWSNVANSMTQHKDTRCKSYNSMDNTITRAEAIYMLYLLNE